MVGADVLVLDGGKDADLIECVLFLLVGKLAHLHLFQGVLNAVALPDHRIHAAVSALTL